MTLEAFATSADLSIGVELELQIVNTMDYDLAPASSDLMRLIQKRRFEGDVKPEITSSMIELSTGVCTSARQALQQLEEIRGHLVDCASQLDVRLSGGGTHPFQKWHQRRIYEAPRFHQISALYGYLAKQFTIFGQHVHVGCSSPDQALALLHGLSRYIPHLIALAAASPFVQGVDTGFASARLNSVFAFPLSGRAPFVLTWDEFRSYFDKMRATGVVEGMKDFYWDIRPKPEFGTIEVRVLDTPLTIRKAAAIAAYIQALSRWITIQKPFVLTEDDYLCYTFNRFQACRFGLEATYVEPETGRHVGLREAIWESFRVLSDHADALGCTDELEYLALEIDNVGHDADWLRRLHSDEDLLPEVVRRQTCRWHGDEP